MKNRARLGKKLCAVLTSCALLATSCATLLNTVALAAPEAAETAQVGYNETLKLRYDTMAGTNFSGNAYDNNESFYKALPIGNGRIGAMVYGNYPDERFDLNEATFWSGGPGKNDKAGAADKLAQAQELLFNEQYKQADSFISSNMIGGGEAKYQSVGNLDLKFGHNEVSNYSRQLDMNTGVVSSEYTYDGKTYRRESFVSYPDQVLVTKITSDTPGAVSLTAQYGCSLSGQYTVESEGTDTLVMDGHGDNGAGVPFAVWFQARTKILNTNGSVSAGKDSLTVKDADSVVILTAIRTNFTDYETCDTDQEALAKEDIAKASVKSYDELYENFEADYRELFGRVDVDLGDGNENDKPMAQRIREFKDTQDPNMVEVLFQYGRYLMICGSRDSQPMNLQGIWNKFRNPAWDCKYTTNINYEMNYWPALTTNLEECFQPFVEKAKALSEAGNYTARNTFGIEKGWVVNHNTDLWNRTAPIDGAWGMWPVGGAWISNQLFDAYNFNQDPDYLSEIYPVVKGSADFLNELMREKEINGQTYQVIVPSNSPEVNMPRNSGGQGACTGYSVTMDNGISRELFQNVINASEDLNVDAELRSTLEDKVTMIRPDQIGSWGQIQEWAYDWDSKNERNRHISHAYNLYPGNMVSLRNTPDLYDAMAVSLNARGDEGTGWSEGWKLNCWARMEDGEHAYNLVKLLISPVNNNGRLYDNLWDAHPPFQIDGNFGFTSGIAEMLMQSQNDEIKLLPAIPARWSDGHANGLRARGNFEVDQSWADGKLTSVTITSNSGSVCNLRYGDKTLSFPTVAGASYTLNGNLEFTEGTAGTLSNVALNKTATGSNETSAEAAKAVDNDDATYWADLTDNSMGGQWLALDLGKQYDISRWVVKAPGTEDRNYIPRDFVLQKSDDGVNWTDVDAVNGNQMDMNNRNVPTFTAQYVRLYIKTATQDNAGGARISGFELYGTEPVAAEGIAIDKESLTIDVGSSARLNATVLPEGATNKTVVWSSSDESVAAVGISGVVTAVGVGSATITATTADGKHSATCEVTAVPVSVTGVKLDKTSIELEINHSSNLYATVLPANATNKAITWASGDESIATVDNNGAVTAVSQGETDITVTTADGQFTATCAVKVVPYQPKNVALNKEATAPGNNRNEEPSKAVDGATSTKWCFDGKGNWLKLDLGAEYDISRWVVVSAGIAESTGLNTRGCTLQKSDDGENWVDVDKVTDNTATVMEREVDTFTARYVRLVVDDPVQPGQASYLTAARIHEFELWGVPTPATLSGLTVSSGTLKPAFDPEVRDYTVRVPNDVTEFTLEGTVKGLGTIEIDHTGIEVNPETGAYMLQEGENKLRLDVVTEGTLVTQSTTVTVIRESVVTDADKTILNKVLEKAEELYTSDEYRNAISSVQESFLAALEYAREVSEKSSYTQKEVDAAWIHLMTEIHKLGLMQGDKSALIENYELYSNIDLGLYIDDDAKANFIAALAAAKAMIDNHDAVQSEVDAVNDALVAAAEALTKRGDKTALQTLVNSTLEYDENNYAVGWDAFETARDAANAVLADNNATQDAVNEAMDALLTAVLNLRYKADKEILNQVIGQVKALDLSGYTPESILALNAALQKAEETAADESLSQEDQPFVDQVLSDLNKAVAGLTLLDGTPAKLSVDGDGNITGASASAKTGEASPVSAMAVAALLAGAAVVLNRKKRK